MVYEFRKALKIESLFHFSLSLPTMKINGCYANILNNCSVKISKEHVISKGILGLKMRAEIMNKVRFVSKGSMVVYNLCVGHNNQLSPADAEIINLTQFLSQDADRYPLIYNSSEPHNLTLPYNYQVDGKNLETWLVKTAINYKYFMHGRELARELPIDYLVQRLFNGKNFEYPFGLFEYNMDFSRTSEFPGSIFFHYHRIYETGEIYGITVNLQGHFYFISLSADWVHEVIRKGVLNPYDGFRYFPRMDRPEQFSDDSYKQYMLWHPPGLRTSQTNDKGDIIERSNLIFNW